VICDNTLQRADNSKTYLATADQDDTTAHIIAIFWTCRNEWWSWLLKTKRKRRKLERF